MTWITRGLALVAVAACGGTSPPSASTTLVEQNEVAALLSVWGSDPSDVWVVGGRPDLMSGPTVLHLEGGAWSRVDSGQTGIDLWWVFGFAGGDVLFSGSGGTILRYRDGAFEKMMTPTAPNGIIFGMWGPTPDDIWAVGRADVSGGAIVWHFDGTTWSAVPPPAGFPAGLLGFKVNGQRTDDVWISCSGGATLHWDGSTLEAVQTADTVSLFSIVTTATDVVTAGDVTQQGAGALYENAGTGWTAAALTIPFAWRGLGASGNVVYVVGDEGLIARRDDTGAWALVKQSLIQLPFHAPWVDPDGGFWGVGGNYDQAPLTQNGFLLYIGTEHVPPIE